MSLQSPMTAKSDAVMANPSFYRAVATISRNRDSAMHVCRHVLCQLKASGPSQDGIHDTRQRNGAENERGHARHF